MPVWPYWVKFRWVFVVCFFTHMTCMHREQKNSCAKENSGVPKTSSHSEPRTLELVFHWVIDTCAFNLVLCVSGTALLSCYQAPYRNLSFCCLAWEAAWHFCSVNLLSAPALGMLLDGSVHCFLCPLQEHVAPRAARCFTLMCNIHSYSAMLGLWISVPTQAGITL